jgi:hypothetical protein
MRLRHVVSSACVFAVALVACSRSQTNGGTGGGLSCRTRRGPIADNSTPDNAGTMHPPNVYARVRARITSPTAAALEPSVRS